MSSAKSNYEYLKAQVKAGGKWERSFRKKTFRRFTPEEIQRKEEEMRRILAAKTPALHQLKKDVTCPKQKHKGKDLVECGHVFKKKDEWVPQGVLLLVCPECGERHTLTVRPDKSAIRNPKAVNAP
jgi:hypothetical protein